MLRRVAILALCLTPASAQATAIIVFRTPTRIILASDSLVQTQTSRDNVQRETACKIVPAGRWWATVGGFMGSGAMRGPDAFLADLRRVLGPTRTLADARDALVQHVAPTVKAGLAAAHAAGLRQMFSQPGQMVASIVVAGTNDGDSTLRVGVFLALLKAMSPLDLTLAWLECPGAWCDEDGRVFYGTSIAEGPAVSLVQAPRPAWVERADSRAARRIIAEQVAATPTQVQGPIDVLQITATGATWAERGKCAGS